MIRDILKLSLARHFLVPVSLLSDS